MKQLHIAHSQLATFLILIILSITSCNPVKTDVLKFNSEKAYEIIEQQVSFGPRFPGSAGHKDTIKFIESTLRNNGWDVKTQQIDYMGFPVINIIGKIGEGSPWIILGAHYDTRQFADQDLDLFKREKPVIGANDGGSGVGILLELSRVLSNVTDKTIWLVFFDQEDNGGINNRDWIMGSRAFVDSLVSYPDNVVILDMVADSDLNLFYERNSDVDLMKNIWGISNTLGYSDYFIPEYRYSMLDDHTPFVQAGIPAIDIIDFDYIYWHTTKDTIDKISKKSLEIVGTTIQQWISSINK